MLGEQRVLMRSAEERPLAREGLAQQRLGQRRRAHLSVARAQQREGGDRVHVAIAENRTVSGQQIVQQRSGGGTAAEHVPAGVPWGVRGNGSQWG
jgi:hypothetical protein